jgi:hypothetical protein
MEENFVTEHLDNAYPEKNKSREDTSKDIKNGRVLGVLALCLVLAAIITFFVMNPIKDPLGRSIVEVDEQDPLLNIIDDNNYVYNNYEFTYDELLWITKINRDNGEYIMSLHHGPRDLQDVSRAQNLKEFLKYTYLYENELGQRGTTFLQFPPDAKGVMGVAFLEMHNNIQEGIGIQVHPAFSNNNTDRKDVPVKNCEDTEEPMIVLRHASPTQITYPSENCVIVQGIDKEIWRSVDLLLYTLMGVIP